MLGNSNSAVEQHVDLFMCMVSLSGRKMDELKHETRGCLRFRLNVTSTAMSEHLGILHFVPFSTHLDRPPSTSSRIPSTWAVSTTRYTAFRHRLDAADQDSAKSRHKPACRMSDSAVKHRAVGPFVCSELLLRRSAPTVMHS